MKVQNSSIYTQNLAELNSAKTTRKENNESFDVVLENETKTNGIKVEDIKTSSDLNEYLIDKAINDLGQERGVLAWFLSVAAAFNIALGSVIKDNPELDINDAANASINKLAENYKSPDDLKQDIISRISMIQSDILYVPGTKSKEEYEIQKQDTINALTQIYKELFNEEPIVPKYETVSNESSIDISAAIQEFLNKPFENDEEDELIQFMKELYKDRYESKDEEAKIKENELKDKELKESFSIEKLALKERFTKEQESLRTYSLNVLLQSL